MSPRRQISIHTLRRGTGLRSHGRPCSPWPRGGKVPTAPGVEASPGRCFGHGREETGHHGEVDASGDERAGQRGGMSGGAPGVSMRAADEIDEGGDDVLERWRMVVKAILSQPAMAMSSSAEKTPRARLTGDKPAERAANPRKPTAMTSSPRTSLTSGQSHERAAMAPRARLQ